MALGGGTFVSQNKTLPGAYANVVSARSVSGASADRGTAALALPLDWGEGEMIEVTASSLSENALTTFGCAESDEKLKPIREVLLHAGKVYVFSSVKGGTIASNDYAQAKKPGSRGNSLKIVITNAGFAENGETVTSYTVDTYLGALKVDSQTVAAASGASGLVDNDFVSFKKSASLSATAGTALTGGADGSTAAHGDFLSKSESYPGINAIGTASEDGEVNRAYIAHTKRLRDDIGIKRQCVVYDTRGDSEGCITVGNCKELVFWTLGVAAGTNVNKSATNMLYDGGYTIPTDYTQSELETYISQGVFVLHSVGTEKRVLKDINSLITTSDDKGDIFKSNQTVRVADNIVMSIADIFNIKYLGKVPNDEAGRDAYKADIASVLSSLLAMRAVDAFDEDDIIVKKGNEKGSVVSGLSVVIAGVMEKLYLTCEIA